VIIKHGIACTIHKPNISWLNGSEHPSWKWNVAKTVLMKGNAGGIFFYSCGIVHKDIIPEGTTVNKEQYLLIYKKQSMRSSQICGKFLGITPWWCLAHCSIHIQQEMAKHGTVMLPHLPYFPHISTCSLSVCMTKESFSQCRGCPGSCDRVCSFDQKICFSTALKTSVPTGAVV